MLFLKENTQMITTISLSKEKILLMIFWTSHVLERIGAFKEAESSLYDKALFFIYQIKQKLIKVEELFGDEMVTM